MREVGRQSEIAKRRQAVGFDGIVGKRGEGRQTNVASAPPAPAFNAALRVNAKVIESSALWLIALRDVPRLSALR